ncbi:hypothetical protein C9J01_19200 [Photobacterium rosenbergii]|uniref:DUF4268 domain-containing protein n=1 Tax=Photobacterium rosenbergii TaxID=294936 RepID=A0A2T3N9X4_9GAMM|nr:DUF4268 domain-containing protein [Photobacterium rosenbergii]PSW10336.1 hypothetical protein C9J01_19200 [Photobacterium rosenbergii]
MPSENNPLIVSADQSIFTLQRVDFSDNSHYNEKWLQELVFHHTSLLPLYEVEPDYDGAIPVGMELQTRSGRIDCLYVTHTGRFVLAEVKLYRNPESRREVMGQVLDYAKDLVSMDYLTLDKLVKKSNNGASLFDIVSRISPNLPEAQFIDAVQRNLSKGRFLLLVVGDGIREGAFEIKEFLNRNAAMEFTFATVEMRVYHMENGQFLVQPQVINKTEIIERHVIAIENSSPDTTATLLEDIPVEDDDVNSRPTGNGQANKEFWGSLMDSLVLDDKTQPLPTASTQSHITFQLPPTSSVSWITAYKLGNGQIGVFVRFGKSEKGRALFQAVYEARAELDEEALEGVSWHPEERKIVFPCLQADLANRKAWDDAFAYYQHTVNIAVNTFRPLLRQLISTES